MENNPFTPPSNSRQLNSQTYTILGFYCNSNSVPFYKTHYMASGQPINRNQVTVTMEEGLTKGRLTADIGVKMVSRNNRNTTMQLLIPSGRQVVISGNNLYIMCEAAGGRRKKRRSTKHRRNRRSKATRKN